MRIVQTSSPALTRKAGERHRASRRIRGGSSVEYMLILVLAVFPMAMMAPTFTRMIKNYTGRIAWAIRLPVG